MHEQMSTWTRIGNAESIVEAGFDIDRTVKYLTAKYIGASTDEKNTSAKI